MKRRPKSLALRAVVELLRTEHDPPGAPPTRDIFELILWENIAYLASPERRRLAFAKLKNTVGTRPEQILAARKGALEKVTALGILKKGTAAKVRECARIAVSEYDANMGPVRRQPIPTAVKGLQAFPSIGRPGAERILLFANRPVGLAPESNGIRVLERVGLIPHDKRYDRMYEASRGLTLGARTSTKLFQEAHLLLQAHGRTLCRRTSPRCSACPLMEKCAYALSHGKSKRGPG
jgi:endonuclease III